MYKTQFLELFPFGKFGYIPVQQRKKKGCAFALNNVYKWKLIINVLEDFYEKKKIISAFVCVLR